MGQLVCRYVAALRVAGTLGELKGVREHTLAASNAHVVGVVHSNNNSTNSTNNSNSTNSTNSTNGTNNSNNRAVWRATRDLRCRAAPGDVLLVVGLYKLNPDDLTRSLKGAWFQSLGL
jgi:hypothetical protein